MHTNYWSLLIPCGIIFFFFEKKKMTSPHFPFFELSNSQVKFI